MFTHGSPSTVASSDSQKVRHAVPGVEEYPALLLKSFRVVRSFVSISATDADAADSSGLRVWYSGRCCGVRFDGGERG